MTLIEHLLQQVKQQPKVFGHRQQQAALAFEKKGLPRPKEEAWKYTPVRPLFERTYQFPSSLPAFNPEPLIQSMPVPQESVLILVLNGQVIDLSGSLWPEGFQARVINQQGMDTWFDSHFARLSAQQNDSLTELHTSLTRECLLLTIAENVKLTKPVFILRIVSSAEPIMIHQRLMIRAGKHSSACITVMNLSASNSSEAFSHLTTEIFIEENADLVWDLIQQENSQCDTITSTCIQVDTHGKFCSNTLTYGGRLTRNNLHLTLAGSYSQAQLNGLYLLSGNMHGDNHTAVIHAVPYCSSNQTYKGVISDSAHGVFNGRIVVERHAQKTQAYQSNKNILLSRQAVINAKPQLEIFADDVKCTHGATTGQIDEQALFYLRSRGIDRQKALALLIQAFAREVIQSIPNPLLADYIHQVITEKYSSLPSLP
jgi:Fe-S cluster assembly protein SufD